MFKRLMYASFLISLWLWGVSVEAVIKSAATTLVITYIIAPLIYHFCPAIQRHLIFLTFVNYPKQVKFYEPETEGLPGTKNFYLESEKGINIGVWHILPESLILKSPCRGSNDYDEWYDNSLSDERPVLLYLHGNTSSRAIAHRVELYNVLRKLDWHVVAFDYRGYADSTTNVTMCETGVVHDAKVVYRHVKRLAASSPFIVWGHSLGTGVSCSSIGSLCLAGEQPSALILESPFNNLRDEVKYHPLTSIFRKMPCFEWLFLKPLESTDISFKSDEHINHINVPILMFHAEDDLVVPFILGKKLYESALKYRENMPPVKFIPFSSNFSYGHKFICRAPELPSILRTFLHENNIQKEAASR